MMWPLVAMIAGVLIAAGGLVLWVRHKIDEESRKAH